jgi:phosphoglycerate dehydrogenase-like enzyme
MVYNPVYSLVPSDIPQGGGRMMSELLGKGIRMLVQISMPQEQIRQIQALAPQMRIDQLKRSDARYYEALREAHIVVGWPRVEDLPQAGNLRWLQIAGAGANRYVDVLPSHVILTNASGVFGIPIAEHVFAMMLAFTRGIPQALDAAKRSAWLGYMTLGELFGSTCGIVGLGDIGTEVARRAKAFGMRVIAVKRTLGTKPECVDELRDASALDWLLESSDHVVVTLPGTVHTTNMIDAGRLSLMRPGSYIYNIGRGSVIDESALIQALREGRPAGAGLDVFADEPLPVESDLWRLPNVIITPHVAGSTPQHGARLAQIVMRNLPRFLAGQPLENLVDRYWGY